MKCITRLLAYGITVLLGLSHSYAEDGKSISFVTIGDSGYEGTWYDFFGSWYGVRSQSWAPGQTGLPVMSKMLQQYCKTNVCQFGVMVGDNIYPDGVEGLNAAEDQKRFDEVFIKPFSPLMTHNPEFRIYPVLGNHDWRGKRKGAAAQLAFLKETLPFEMQGFFYKVTPKGAEGLVDVFLIDTQMLLSQVTVYEHHLNDDGSEARDLSDIDDTGKNTLPLSDTEKKQLAWFKDALTASTAQWKVVIGHHPLWSSGSSKFEEAHALRDILMPTLCGNVDIYIAGHEHTQEMHSDSCETVMAPEKAKPLLHVVSGAFSKSRLVNPAFRAYQDRTYPQLRNVYAVGKQPEGAEHQYKQTWGFSHITLENDTATVRMITQIEDQPVPNTITPGFTCTFKRDEGFLANGCAPNAE